MSGERQTDPQQTPSAMDCRRPWIPIPRKGLSGVTAIPVHTGADFTHATGPTSTLAPLIAELGASVPGRGFCLALSPMDKDEEVVYAAVED